MYKTIKKCSVDELNEKLAYLKANNRIFVFREPTDKEIIGRFKCYFYKKVTQVYLIYKDLKGNGRVIQYQSKLDCEFDGVKINGANALAILHKYYKAPEIKETPFSLGVSPYRNPKFVGKRTHNCYGYDLNSAYPYGMLQDLPDTTQPLKPGIVGKNEYSFTPTGLKASVGSYSIYRFKIMKSPYEKFVNTWYNKKANAKNASDKNTAKFVMNAAIGALQNHNCYLRAAIINNFHNIINDLFIKYKDHILSTNVDSIVSDIPIPEIENNLGNAIGQWKLEHFGDFAIHPNGYSVQWNKDLPNFGAGKSKHWFKDDYDILVDPIPEPNNLYEIDYKNLQIVKRS